MKGSKFSLIDGHRDLGTRGLCVATAAWPEVGERLANGALAVLPIGAASKEHGRHLPLATDYLQMAWLSERVIQRREIVVWPIFSYGYYPAFVDFPGSVSLSRATFIDAVGDVLEGIIRAGARRIVLFNSGISTIQPLEDVLQKPQIPVPVMLVNVYDGPEFARVRAQVEEQPWGGHADELETSLMLAIAPDLVDMQRAEAAPTEIVRGLFNRRDAGAPNYSPAGVNGDPTRATRVKGERLLKALLDDVLQRIDAFTAK